ncbi:hypothetical protein Q5P01_002924 [Channa striata]|uniref:C2H2-type domain-containing protein n=1 Tax=Channa striata TaxID=64152 RepID=A0AA88NNF2_CHASR|nr:hypothetical protein Q5P01_002924 [Channa striata]
MQAERAERKRQPGRGRRGESGQSRAETRGIQPAAAVNSARDSEGDLARLKEFLTTMQHKDKQTQDVGGRVEGEREEDGELGKERRRYTSSADGERRRRGRERDGTGRRAVSEGRDRSKDSESLRWRINQLEKEKLELTSSHNQELCRLQVELTCLRSSVERGEAQRVELQYQLTVSQRQADQAATLSRDKQALTEQAAELQQTVQELKKALEITQRSREEDQHALRQDVEERDRFIQSFSSENQRLHQLLQDHEEALEESERRIAEVQKEKVKDAELNRRQAEELKYLKERDERSRREKELSDQRVKSLELSIEAERAAHLEFKFNSEVLQLRVRDLEAAVVAERSSQQEAQSDLELLRAKFGEVERAYAVEREKRNSAERTLERLQSEYEQYKSEQNAAMETVRKMTSDLTEKLEEEKRQNTNTHSLLEQAIKRRSDADELFGNCLKEIRETLQQHGDSAAGFSPTAKDDGSWSSSTEVLHLLKTTLGTYEHRLEVTAKQVQDLLFASEKLHEENQTLQQLTSDQSRQMEESQQLSVKLKEEVTRLRLESSDWSTQSHDLQSKLQREREERKREKGREKEDRMAEIQKMKDHHQKESKAHLSFLYRLYQRVVAGCVLLDQPQSILGDFTWEELCDVISEQVDQLTSDLQKANDKIASLQSVCEKKSVCVRELQRSQECVLSRLEASVRKREEAWSKQHTHTVTQLQNQLQVSHSQCDRRQSASFFLACALLAGALRHTHCRLQTLSEQKTLLARQLGLSRALEEEVRRLADALGGDSDDKKEERGRRAVRRWRRSVCVVLAVRRWCALAKTTPVLFRLERSGRGPAVSVCGELATATQKGQRVRGTDKDGGREVQCSRWLRSKRLSSAILSSMADLQGALAHAGSSPLDVMSAARSGLSRLLDHLLDQSDVASCRVDEDTLSSRLRLGLSRVTPQQADVKILVSTLQEHFLLFSQRLHSAEVERRSLRLEVARLKRGLRQEREDTCRMVPAERFHAVCEELQQALNREQEAQMLIQEQSSQLHTLQLQVNTHTSEETNTQNTLSQTTKALSETRQELSQKERSLRILGKHLSAVQKERKLLEERLQRAEDELMDTARRKDCLISCMKAAETSYKEVRDSLVQSERPLSARPHPLLLPRQYLELSGAEGIVGAPEAAACQNLLSTVSQLFNTCSSKIDWLEQEVSAQHSHVTALRSELQDACLRDNLAFVPVECQFADEETTQSAPSSDFSKEPIVSLNIAPSQTIPPACSPLQKPPEDFGVRRMAPDIEESIRCTLSGCSCVYFKPGSAQIRSCEHCGHGWVVHALEKLQAQPPSSCRPVEVALPGLVFDLSSLVLYGAQAIPVRLKILLDRLYSILTPDQVSHILHTLGWSLGDYVRGYMLQYPSGKVLDCWLMVTPEEELLVLKQFLRFGETRPIAELMMVQCFTAVNHLSDPELSTVPKNCQSHISTFIERNGRTPGVYRNTRGASCLVADICHFEKNSSPNHDTVQHFENVPKRLSLLLPVNFPSSAVHRLAPSTKELVPSTKLKQYLQKPSGTKPMERHRQDGGRGRQVNDPILPKSKGELALKIKVDPDKPNSAQSLWQQSHQLHSPQESDLHRGMTKQKNGSLPSSLNSSLKPSSSSSSLYSHMTFSSSSSLKSSQKLQDSSSSSFHPLPSFSSSFLCPPPTSPFSSSLHPLPSSLCSLPSSSLTGGRKGRVCCGVCEKSFYDKGTLKIHYNAVHLKIKHRCTVAGCTMVFSSLRSRNRHSANPNPRLHTNTNRDTHIPKTLKHNWQQDNDACTLKTRVNGDTIPQHDIRAQADSPPQSSQPHTLTNDTQHFIPDDSAYQSKMHIQAPLPPPLLPSQCDSPLSSSTSTGALVVHVAEKPKHCHRLLNFSAPDPSPIATAKCNTQSVSCEYDITEGKQGDTSTSPVTIQHQQWESGYPVPKKKPRKSTMPVKIERDELDMRTNKEGDEG